MDQTERARRKLETDFWNALNRRRDQKETKPADAAGLKRKMEQATTRRLNDSLSLIAASLFRLAPQQWRTLEAAGMTQEQAGLLSGLDHRIKAVEEYDANDLLEVIASPPKSPDGWESWWTENASLASRVLRSRQQEKQSGDARKLGGLAKLMGQAAKGSIPEPAEAATTPEAPEKLSEALKRAHGVMKLAAALSIRPEEYDYRNLSPERISRELNDRGIRCEPDIGTMAPPEELGKRLGWPGAEGFECDYGTNLWWRKRSSPPDGIRYVIADPYQAMPGEETSEPEAKLIRFAAPALPDGRPDGLGALALHNGLTRRQARQLLEGETPDPERPSACPMAGECTTKCREAQRKRIIQFPPTLSGSCEECGYYRFLANHRNSPLREKAARAETEKIIATAKRARREIEPEAEPEEGGPEETPREKREKKAKEPASRQTMLNL